jgi:hypothetical protein
MRLEVDERRMIASVTLENEDGEEITAEAPVIFEVCGRCGGRGSHVNPSIDGHGITMEEWDQDWSEDEREGYLSGRYDVTCYECAGKRVVAVIDETRCDSDVLDQIRRLEREDAEYEAICRAERAMGA